jgi:dihydrofolate synthase/folylpolyglutamate synthase
MLEQLPWPKPESVGEILLGLDRITHFMRLLGDPQLHLPRVIHVAGTNGKGSTTAFIESLLNSIDERVHVYTSPHLLGWNERFKLCGIPIHDDDLREYCEHCREVEESSDLKLSHFEALTAIAFLAMAEHPADFVVLETGLGGRLDATNLVPNPSCTVLTPIAFDHMEYLGNTIEEIAREKCGIIKYKSPCVVGRQRESAHSVIQRHADERHAPLYRHNHEWVFQDGFISSTPHTHKEYSAPIPRPALAGDHQQENLALAVAALTFGCSINLKLEDIEYAAAKTSWPGRIEEVTEGGLRRDLTDYKRIWLDVAHNPHGAAALGHWMEQQNVGKFVVVSHLTRNRRYADFVLPLLGTRIISGIVILESPDPQNLNDLYTVLNDWHCPCIIAEDFAVVIKTLQTNSLFSGNNIVFCGSHNLVGMCKKYQAITNS